MVVGHDGEVMWGIRVKKRARALFRPSSANAPKTVLSFRVCAREKEHHERRRRASATCGEGKGAVKETRPNRNGEKGAPFPYKKRERKEREITLAHRRVKIFLSHSTFGAKKRTETCLRRRLFSPSPESVSLYPLREVKSFLILNLES